jgi:Plasmid pRiA4b ORF-3-like protein
MEPVDHVIFRLRVDLDGASPAIWRRLDIRSDVPLSVVHSVLQAAFDWEDCHLYRFSVGGHPFDTLSKLFLCPFEVADADEGTPAADAILGAVIRKTGDVLRYLYDYGDSWEVTLQLEEVRPATQGAPIAVAVDGRRAGPPEDSGGAVDGKSLAKLVENPARFDLDELNEALQGPLIT